ncbi:MAG: DUF58 domain-containing protein [Candidatus Sumerlaeia bacterium]
MPPAMSERSLTASAPADTRELLKKVRRIEIITNRVVNDVMAGQYHSVFKGRGIEFEEVREYQIGDDVRTIDWNVTARAGRPFVKRYREERELTVVFCVDVSSSSWFGTHERLKGELQAEVCAVLAFSAIRNNDRVGLLLFTSGVERFIPPQKGRKHVLRVVREVLSFRPQGRGTSLRAALEYLNRVVKRRAVVFLMSDFLDEGYENILRTVNRKHDLVAISIADPREFELPPAGILELEDAETGEIVLVDTFDRHVRERFAAARREQAARLRQNLRRMNIDHIALATDQPYDEALVHFFRLRARRY